MRIEAQRFFGLHMVEGLAEYAIGPDGKPCEPYKIYVGEDILKEMDKTFTGKPVYVEHVDVIDYETKDGTVVKSFFEPVDGKHWVEFMVDTQEALEKIRRGWVLSNAWAPMSTKQGGDWHGIEYAYEVVDGAYTHLAIVEKPRYQESIVLTPDEFKLYQEGKKAELAALKNSSDKPKGETMFKFLNKTESKATDMEQFLKMSVVLPKSGIEKTVQAILTNADEMEEKKKNNDSEDADLSHKVKLHDGSMCNVGELMAMNKKNAEEAGSWKEKYNGLANAMGLELEEDGTKAVETSETQNSEEEEKKKKEMEDKKNAEEEEKKKKEMENQKTNSADEARHKAVLAKAAALKNAGPKREEVVVNSGIEFMNDRAERGKQRYGSK